MKTIFLCLTLALLALGGAPVHAADEGLPFQQAEQYFEQRDKVKPTRTYKADDIRTSPQKYQGAPIEVSGIVFGQAGADGECRILVRDKVDTFIEVALPPEDTHEDWPFLSEGSQVRILCKVAGFPPNGGRLVLITAVDELEARILDKIRQIRDAAPPPTPNAPTPEPGGPAPQASGNQFVNAYGETIRQFRPSMPPQEANRVAGMIIKYSQDFKIDPRLVIAVIAQESRFNALARSPVGAAGYGQLMPGTAQMLGVKNVLDPEQNLRGSIQYLAQNINTWTNRGFKRLEAVKRALASYNAGPGNVAKYNDPPDNGVPPFRETQNYVRTITRTYWQMLPDHERTWQPL